MTTFTEQQTNSTIREHLTELLRGGFAPNVILLREFDYNKAGILLDGLHFSAWILLGHIHARHQTLLRFMKNPADKTIDIWPDAHWPENHQPQSEAEWNSAIDAYAHDLEEMIQLVQDPEKQLYELQPNGKTLAWAAMTALHHTGYHIGQLKTIGRQLGVW